MTELQQLDIFGALAQVEAEAQVKRKLPVRDRFKVGDFVQGRFQKGDPLKRGWVESFTMSELLLIRQLSGKNTMIDPATAEHTEVPTDWLAPVQEGTTESQPLPTDARQSSLKADSLAERLRSRGFSEIDHEGFDDDCYELYSYRDWTIGLWIPNGGIVAVDIGNINRQGDRVWSRPTDQEYLQPSFDYHDSEGIRQFAEGAIDYAQFGFQVGDRIVYSTDWPGIGTRTLRGVIEAFEEAYWTAPVARVRVHPTGPLYPCGLRCVTLEGDRDV